MKAAHTVGVEGNSLYKIVKHLCGKTAEQFLQITMHRRFSISCGQFPSPESLMPPACCWDRAVLDQWVFQQIRPEATKKFPKEL